MQERLFDKLNMTSAGFGPPGKEDEIQEPWGHRKLIVTNWIPSQSDNAEALGPAGTVHCSISDWASFVIDLTLKQSSAIYVGGVSHLHLLHVFLRHHSSTGGNRGLDIGGSIGTRFFQQDEQCVVAKTRVPG